MQNFVYSLVVNFIPYDTAYDPFYEKLRKDVIMPDDVLYPFRSSFAIILGMQLLWNLIF